MMKVKVLVGGSGRYDVMCPNGDQYGGRLRKDVYDRADPRYGRSLMGRYSREQLQREVSRSVREQSPHNGLCGGYEVEVEI